MVVLMLPRSRWLCCRSRHAYLLTRTHRQPTLRRAKPTLLTMHHHMSPETVPRLPSVELRVPVQVYARTVHDVAERNDPDHG